MITRFELFVVLRNQVSDRGLLRRALAVEAVMEELAACLGQPAEPWGLAGLGASIDAQLCARNPDRRGLVAAELLRTEGVPEPVCAAMAEWTRGEARALAPLAAGLVVAHALVDAVFVDIDEGESLDDIEPLAAARRVERAARREGEAGLAARRALDCLETLSLAAVDAAAHALTGLRRVREDLRL